MRTIQNGENGLGDEVHIAGVIAYAQPEFMQTVQSAIARIADAQVHAAMSDGRMVITLEAESTKRTLDKMDAIRALPGVLNVALVYQHAELAASMDEEV